MTKDKYLLELEQKLSQQEETIANFKKEQGAAQQLFKDQNKTMENLQSSNSNLIAGHDRLSKTNQQLTKETKNKDKTLKELQTKIKTLESDLAKQIDTTELTQERNQQLTTYKQKYNDLAKQSSSLIEKYTSLEKDYQNLTKSLSNQNQELISQAEKNQLLENKVEELESQELSPYVNGSEWETEKEQIIQQAEQ